MDSQHPVGDRGRPACDGAIVNVLLSAQMRREDPVMLGHARVAPVPLSWMTPWRA